MAHPEAAVDRDHGAADVGGVGGDEEGDDAGDLAGPSSVRAGSLRQFVERARRAGGHVGGDEPGGDDADGDPARASSLASERARPTSPAFEAVKFACPAEPSSATTDDINTMRPLRARSMPWPPAWRRGMTQGGWHR